MSAEAKKTSSKGWLWVLFGVLCGVIFLGLLLLSVQEDTKDVQQYAKTWYGDKTPEERAQQQKEASVVATASAPVENMHSSEHHH